MSVERWIFHEGLRLGECKTINDYLDVMMSSVQQGMTREELIMFYNNLQLAGGYMSVQAKKKWQGLSIEKKKKKKKKKKKNLFFAK
jgi:hypothetical protein